MVKAKVKGENLSKFLNAWDKEICDLNVELRKINLKQKKEQLVIRKKEGHLFCVEIFVCLEWPRAVLSAIFGFLGKFCMCVVKKIYEKTF